MFDLPRQRRLCSSKAAMLGITDGLLAGAIRRSTMRFRRSAALAALFALSLAALPAQQPSASDVESKITALLAAARQAEGQKDFAAASRHYQEILRIEPGWALIHQSLGISYHFQNRYSEAIAAFRKALAFDESLWGAHLFLGMDYYRTNQFRKAVPALERSVALNAKMAGVEAGLWLGLSYVALGRSEDAIRRWEAGPRDVERLYHLVRAYDRRAAELFEHIGQLDPGSGLVAILQAERALSEERWSAAEADYGAAVARRPDLARAVAGLRRFEPTASASGEEVPRPVKLSAHDARANLERAEFLFSRRAEARGNMHLRVLKNAAADDPGSSAKQQQEIERIEHLARTLRNLARAPDPRAAAFRAGLEALDANRSSAAAESFTRALGGAPSRLARLYLVEALFGAGRYQEAVEQLRKLPDEPADLDSFYWLGRTYKQLAGATLASLTEQAPDSYRIDQLTAERLEQNTEYEKALAVYERVFAKQPAAGGVRYALGNVYWKMRRFEEAETWLRGELETNPHHSSAHFRLGNLYVDQGKAEQAITHLERAHAAGASFPTARLDLGRALSAAGRHREAVEQLRAHAAANPSEDRVRYLLAQTYRSLGRLDEAKQAMLEYRQLNRKRLEDVQRDIREAAAETAGDPAGPGNRNP